jgi:2-polyprenyl-3-methyl-5-hydroxy-6-metoxy-1,4-benzoquinol methylase
MRPSRYVSRDQEILKIARGRRVLHLGCVGNTDLPAHERVRLAKESLHWKLTTQADVVGVDYSCQVIEQYRQLGVFDNIIHGDVQSLQSVNIEGVFDVVIAADIIEHLSNPGALLQGIRRFCTPSSQVVITTPHAFGLPNFLRFCVGKFRDGEEHVMTFNSDNVRNLLKRHGYRIERFDTCFQVFARNSRLGFRAGKIVLETFPKLGGTLFLVARTV